MWPDAAFYRDVLKYVVTFLLGVGLTRLVERHPRLLVYFGHIGAFPQPEITTHTHSIVLTNAGRSAATDIRISHHHLPRFNIWPPETIHNFTGIPGEGRPGDIVLPRMVPGETITISYLYFPPLTADRIHGSIRHADGFAKPINVLPTRQFSRPVQYALLVLLVVGGVTAAHWVVRAAEWIITHW